MRLAHLADCHLGFRSGHRTTAGGLNAREHDVAEAFRRAVDGILLARPDMVCIAGDLFHVVRPSNAAVTCAFQGLARLRQAGLQVVIAAGNHEQPRTTDAASILHLFAELGVDVATTRVRQFVYPELDLAVTAAPDRAPLEGIAPGAAAHRVLVIHGAVEGACPTIPGIIPKTLAESTAWDYLAFGDFHVQQQIGPRAWYAGSTEYTSSDIWRELAAPKAWLLVDLQTGAVVPQPIPPSRLIVDLPPVQGGGLSPEALMAQMRERLESIALDGAVVRLVVLDVARATERQLDHAQLRQWRAAALQFRLDVRRPQAQSVGSSIGIGSSGRRKPLGELLAEHLGRHELPPGMDRQAFVQLAAGLFDEDAYCGGTRDELGAGVA